MAVQVSVLDAQGLLDSIYAAIDDGGVQTWSYDDDGDFVHDTADKQWVGAAWLRPKVSTGSLTLNVVPPKDSHVSSEAYAVYHGRFIEMLLAHFDESFSEVSATAMPTSQDQV